MIFASDEAQRLPGAPASVTFAPVSQAVEWRVGMSRSPERPKILDCHDSSQSSAPSS